MTVSITAAAWGVGSLVYVLFIQPYVFPNAKPSKFDPAMIMFLCAGVHLVTSQFVQ